MSSDWNDAVEQMLAQGREFQKQMSDAMNRAAEDVKPQLAEAMQQAQQLQATLLKHAAETGSIASTQAQAALGHLSEFVKIGGNSVRESAEQARAAAAEMADQARRMVEAATAAAAAEAKKPGE
jgi:hypothetical protein